MDANLTVHRQYIKNSLSIDSSSTIESDGPRAGLAELAKYLVINLKKLSQKFVNAKLENQPDKRYPGNGDSSLIDFKRGAVDGADENYIGFEGTDMVAWLDLGGNKCSLTGLSASYLVNHGSFVLAPAQLEVWAATEDGKKINRLGVVSTHESGLQKEAKRKVLSLKFPRQSLQIFNRKIQERWKASHPGTLQKDQGAGYL